MFIVWADPENSARGRLDNFLFSSTYFTEGRTNLPREAIGLKGSNCFSKVCNVLDSNLLSSRFFQSLYRTSKFSVQHQFSEIYTFIKPS